MNKNLKLSTSTSLQSIASQALRAAAISIADRKKEHDTDKKKNKKKSKKRTLSPLEQSMFAIKKTVETRVPEHLVVVYDTPDRMSAAHSIITLYRKDEYEKYLKQKSGKEATQSGKKPKKPRATLKFVFYRSYISLDALGSIAVYGKSVDDYYNQLMATRHIFGIPFQSVKVEMGLYPYLDIKIRA